MNHEAPPTSGGPQPAGFLAVLLSSTLVMVVAVALAFNVLMLRQRVRDVRDGADGRLLAAAEMLRELVGVDYHDGIADASSVPPERFARIVERNDDLCRRLGLQYLWSVLQVDGDLVFTTATRSDLGDPESPHAGFFEVHRDPAAFAPALASAGVPVFSTFHNEWGEGRMVLVPRRDSGGRAYLFGASIQLAELVAMKRKAALATLASGFAVMLCALLPTFLLARWLAAPVLRLAGAADRMASGDIETPFVPAGVREVRSLAASCEGMRQALKRQMDAVRRREAMLEGENRVLATVAGGEDLAGILEGIARFGESLDPDVRVSILLYDSERQCLVHGAGPSLTEEYNDLLRRGLKIGPEVGSCGSAAYHRRLVTVADIERDARWTAYPDFVARVSEQGIKACWSQPILSAEGELLGTVANYSDRVGEPGAEALRVLDWSVDMASLSLGNVRQEEALRKSENLFRNIFEILPIGLWIADKEGTLLRGNPAGVAIWGAEPKVGQSEYGVFKARRLPSGEEIAPDDWALMRTVKKGETIVDELLEIDAFDGTKKVILNYTAPVLDEEGRVEAAIIVNLDVTERRRMENENLALANIIKRSQDFIGVADGEGHAFYVNPAGRALVGLAGEDAAGSTEIKDYFAEEDLPFLEGTILPTLLREGRWYGEFRLRHFKTGEPIPVLYDLFLTENPETGQVTNISTVIRDISDRKRAEEERERLLEQLMQSRKLESVGRLAGGVAHEFNNILQAIIGNAELALEDAGSDGPVREEIAEIIGSARRAAGITRQLLAFARKQTVCPEVLDLNAAVGDLLRMLRRLLGEHVELQWVSCEGLWPVLLDPVQFGMVLTNLCVNARDSVGESGWIAIECRNAVVDEAHCARHPDARPGEYVVLAVSDDGCGMDPETIEQVFEPFFTTKEVGEGTGLGLPTVQGIALQNGGFVGVYSEVGRGTTFRVYFPRCPEGEGVSGPRRPAAAALPRGTETVLVAEDNVDILRVCASLLGRLGYRVLAAHSPTEALRLAAAEAGPIHLLVSDLVMPEMDGISLADRVREAHPDIACLYMSGYTAKVVARHGILAAGLDFMQKPFAAADFAGKVREILDRPAAS